MTNHETEPKEEPEIDVHPRIARLHPEIEPADAIEAFTSAFDGLVRLDTDPLQRIGIGFDRKGRLLEWIAVPQTEPEGWLIFHCMEATKKFLREIEERK